MNALRLVHATVCGLAIMVVALYSFVNWPKPEALLGPRNLGQGAAATEPTDPALMQEEEPTPGPEIARAPVGVAGIKSAGYDEGRQILEVEYSNGRVYRWYGVPAATWHAWRECGFHHDYFHHHIHHRGLRWRPVVHLGDRAPPARPGTLGGPPARLGEHGDWRR